MALGRRVHFGERAGGTGVNCGIVIVGGERHLSASMVSSIYALAAMKGVNVSTCHEPPPPPIDLDALIQQFDLPTLPKIEEPFFSKETAYERRNRGQKWYRRFEKKPRRK